MEGGSPMGSEVLEEPAPAWASHRVTASCGGNHLLWNGVLQGLQVTVCSNINLHGLPHHGLLHDLQGNLCSGVCSTSSLSFFTDLAVRRIFSSLFFFLPYFCLTLAFVPFLKYAFTEAPPALLMSSACASSRAIAVLAGLGCVGHGATHCLF